MVMYETGVDDPIQAREYEDDLRALIQPRATAAVIDPEDDFEVSPDMLAHWLGGTDDSTDMGDRG
jgi:hypothetical protein